MPSTKIINVLKSETFEDTLDLFKSTSANEVIFVLPKKAKAFSKEFHFQALAQACSDEGKIATFMSSDSEVLDLAKKYGISVLASESRKPARSKVVATPVSVALMDDNENEAAFERDLDDEIDMILPQTDDEEELEDDFLTPRKTKIVDEDELDDLDSDLEKDELDEDLEDELEDEEDIEDLDDDFKELPLDEEEAEPVFSPASEPMATFAMAEEKPIRRDMEGIVVPRDTRPVKINAKSSRPVSLDVRRESPDESSDDLRNVWQKSSNGSLWAGIGNKTEKKPWSQRFSFSMPSFGGKKLITSLAVVSGVALLAILFLVEGKATVSVEPKTHDLNFSFKVSASDSVATPDEKFNKIPGQVFKINKDATAEFVATGQKEVAQKARGTLVVHNDLNTPQTLIATTRFQYTQNGTPADLIFRSLTSITVPAKGTANVEVIADKPGQTYNVAPGRFVIVAFKEKGDTQRYENVYGQSNTNFTGGISGNAKVVTEKDYNDAKTVLTTQLNEEVKKSISEQASNLLVIQNQTSAATTVKSTAQIDEAAERFSMTISGASTIIGFKREDLDAIISAYVSKNNNLDVRPADLNLSYSEIDLNSEGKILDFRVTVKGMGYEKVDSAMIITNLKGKNQAQVETYLKTLNFIKSAKVMLSPFWIRKVPLNEQKIEVKVI